MIIVDREQTSPSFSFRRWIRIGLLLACFLLGIALSSHLITAFSPTYPEGVYFCDAETRDGESFIGQGGRFGGGASQSADRAFSGKYASKVVPGWELQFGFSIRLNNLEPGTYYQASVWHYTNFLDKGTLVVQGVGEGAFYQTARYPYEKRPNGWEKIQLIFQVPEAPVDYIHVYVVNNGQITSYFDDLQVAPIPNVRQSLPPSTLHLELADGDYRRLQAFREQAVEQGLIHEAQKAWVEGHLRTAEGPALAAKVRLKGDLLDHLIEEKWSFRIQLSKHIHWNHLQTFSLQTPAARYYLKEWLLHQCWQQEGVLATPYDFVQLQLNGQDLGLYAYEGHFDQVLLEHQKRRPGPILKFEETGFWQGAQRQLDLNSFDFSGAHQAIRTSDVAAIRTFSEDDFPQAVLQNAIALLDGFRKGTHSPAMTFDLDKMARFFAVCDVFQAYHGIAWHNLRFYFNPLSNRLEPIGFDGCTYPGGEPVQALGQGGGYQRAPLFQELYRDTTFMAAYHHHLMRISSRDYLRNFLDGLRSDLLIRQQWLSEEFKDFTWKEASFVQTALQVHSLLLPFSNVSLQASVAPDQLLQLVNWHSFPLQLLGSGQQADQLEFPLGDPLLLPPYAPREFLQRLEQVETVEVLGNLSHKWLSERSQINQYAASRVTIPALRGRYLFFKVPGLDTVFSTPIQQEPLASTVDIPTLEQLQKQHPLASGNWYVVQGKTVQFKQAPPPIDALIAIPPGYEVQVMPGTHLDFVKGGGLLSQSPIYFHGTEEAPIQVLSSDQNNRGLTVLQASEESILKYVNFERLRPFKMGQWQLSGAVTFYESDFQLSHCNFQRMQGEDALNGVRSEVLFEYCRWVEAPSDAVDLDFCKGQIRSSSFQRSGNDGLDVSGSILEVRDCFFRENGDKALSVGEHSDLALFDIRIEQAKIGIASKDRSVVLCDGLVIIDSELGLAAYQKKPSFGGGFLVVKDFVHQGLGQTYQVDPLSSLEVDGAHLQ